MAEPEAQGGFAPPYNISWTTFLNTVNKVMAEWPNKVDRSYLGTTAGNVQTYLISALRGFGLIGADHRITPAFKAWDTDSEARPGQIETLLRTYYPTIIDLGSTNATDGELSQAFAEAFPTIGGASRVKAIRFFLAAAEFAKLPKSPLWKAPRATPSSIVRRPRSRGATPRPNETPPSSRGAESNMKQRYFDLLLKKAEESNEIDTDLLDRLERVAGLKEDSGAN